MIARADQYINLEYNDQILSISTKVKVTQIIIDFGRYQQK